MKWRNGKRYFCLSHRVPGAVLRRFHSGRAALGLDGLGVYDGSGHFFGKTGGKENPGGEVDHGVTVSMRAGVRDAKGDEIARIIALAQHPPRVADRVPHGRDRSPGGALFLPADPASRGIKGEGPPRTAAGMVPIAPEWYFLPHRAGSSAGRAVPLQGIGRRFEPCPAHQGIQWIAGIQLVRFFRFS